MIEAAGTETTVGKCYLCGGARSRPLHPRVRDRDDIAVLKCLSCDFVYLSRTDHIHVGFYEASGMYGGAAPDVPALLRSEIRDTERRVAAFRSIVGGKDYLDFGCGAGAVLAALSTVTNTAEGVELNDGLRELIRRTSGIKTYSSIAEIGRKYDVITLFHVLEHLADPRAVLARLGRSLKPGGCIYVEVPNADDALIGLYDCAAFRSFTFWSCHLYLFTTATLHRIVEQAGLAIETVEQVQRYPLANHLYWLTEGRPGGHEKWSKLDQPFLNEAYSKFLASQGACDTLVAKICLAT